MCSLLTKMSCLTKETQNKFRPVSASLWLLMSKIHSLMKYSCNEDSLHFIRKDQSDT